MQLVGATRGFIRRPFLFKSALHGIYGAFIAIALLIGILYFAQKELKEIISLQDVEIIGILFFFVLLVGIIINWISTFFAVNKFLRLKADDLYY